VEKRRNPATDPFRHSYFEFRVFCPAIRVPHFLTSIPSFLLRIPQFAIRIFCRPLIPRFAFRIPRFLQYPVADDRRTQTALSFERRFRSGTECPVHPITGPGLLAPKKLHPLHLERLADQIIQGYSAGNNITAKHSRRTIPNAQLDAKLIVNFLGEEGDLALVIFAMSEESVSFDALAGHTINVVNLLDRMIRGFFPMMAKEIVARRDIKMPNIELN
jgi:hypothetical protein